MKLTTPCPHTAHLDAESLALRFSTKRWKSKDVSACSECSSKDDVWACLNGSCTYIGCGRTSHGHCLRHYEKQSSASQPHCVCVNINSGMFWCYACNRELLPLETEDTNNGCTPAAASILGKIATNLLVREDKSSTDEDHDEPEPLTEGASRRGVVGLENLGNTCYMNAALQALSHSVPLTAYFRECSAYVRLKRHNAIVDYYADLIKALWDGKDTSISPANFLREVKALNPMFRGLQQQDSQEFLRFILDRLHEELKRPAPVMKVHPVPIQHVQTGLYSHLPTGKRTSRNLDGTVIPTMNGVNGINGINKVNGVMNGAVNGNHTNQAEQSPGKEPNKSLPFVSIISDTFGGLLQSQVVCLECEKSSISEDPFYDLSVQIHRKPFGASETASNASSNSPLPSSTLSTTASTSVSPSPSISPSPSVASSTTSSTTSTTAAPSTAPSDTASISSGNSISHNNGSRRENDGKNRGSLLSSLASNLTNWLGISGAPIKLQDCLNAFFATEELTGTERYRCEHCKKLNDSTKTLRLIKLPEVLCVHLKRFRYDAYFPSKINTHVSFPLEGLSLKSYCRDPLTAEHTKYNLFAVVNHRGGFGGGHYVAYARNDMDRHWYEFDDSRVTRKSASEVERVEAYLLFYRRRSVARSKERKRVLPLITSPSNNVETVLLSRAWYNRWLNCIDPGPVSNYDFLCHHGGYNRSATVYKIEISQLAISVPLAVFSEYVAQFGSDGARVCSSAEVCVDCENEERELQQRREYEASRISQLDSNVLEAGQCWFLISSRWLQQWTAFKKGGPIAGPINNSLLVDNEGKPRKNLKRAEDYRGVNQAVWEFFFAIYGGGPPIVRDQLDLYSPAVAYSGPRASKPIAVLVNHAVAETTSENESSPSSPRSIASASSSSSKKKTTRKKKPKMSSDKSAVQADSNSSAEEGGAPHTSDQLADSASSKTS